MYDANTHLRLARTDQRERADQAVSRSRAVRLQQLRRLDRRVSQATTRARLVRLALN